MKLPNQYYLKREIALLEKELLKIKNESVVRASSTGTAHTATVGGSRVENRAVIIADIERTLEMLKTKAEKEKITLLDILMSIDDSRLRQIIYLRNINCMSWRQIAQSIGGGNTPSGVRMAYVRFVNKLRLE